MAGHAIALYFKERGHRVTAYSVTPFPHCDNIVGNAFETDHFKRVLLQGEYDAVINCIGILNEAADENRSTALYLNSYLPHLIADTLKDTKTKLIHMSTDCVFAGNTGPYNERSLRDGRSFYDRTKALGEVEDRKNLTFRNSIVGPDLNENGIGLFNWFMKQRGPSKDSPAHCGPASRRSPWPRRWNGRSTRISAVCIIWSTTPPFQSTTCLSCSTGILGTTT